MFSEKVGVCLGHTRLLVFLHGLALARGQRLFFGAVCFYGQSSVHGGRGRTRGHGVVPQSRANVLTFHGLAAKHQTDEVLQCDDSRCGTIAQSHQGQHVVARP